MYCKCIRFIVVVSLSIGYKSHFTNKENIMFVLLSFCFVISREKLVLGFLFSSFFARLPHFSSVVCCTSVCMWESMTRSGCYLNLITYLFMALVFYCFKSSTLSLKIFHEFQIFGQCVWDDRVCGKNFEIWFISSHKMSLC